MSTIDVHKLRILVLINGVVDGNGKEVEKKLRMHFRNENLKIQQLIDDVFVRTNLIRKYELVNVKIFDELFNESLEIIDYNEYVTDVTKYTLNVRLYTSKNQV